MQYIYSCLHDIDIIDDFCERIEVLESDVLEYTVKLINEILENPNRKNYKIVSTKKEVVSIVIESVKELRVLNEDADMIASRLFQKEKERQLNMRLDTRIKRGSLFQALLKEEDSFYYIITKIENIDILDTKDLSRKTGPPYENKSFKNCLFKLDNEGEILEIFLSDKNSVVADYWWNLFLELEEMTSDEVNTKNVFNVLSSILRKKIENISPSDHIFFRNQLIGFFKTQEKFTSDAFIEYTFGNNIPECNELDIEQVKVEMATKISKLKDTEFNIISSAIKAKKSQMTKKVNDIVSIVIDGHDEEIKSNIKSFEEHGEQFIRIKTTNKEAFNSFNWN